MRTILLLALVLLIVPGCSSTSDSPRTQSPQLTLIYFDADWCAPCQGLKSTLPEALLGQPETFRLKQVDVDQEPILAELHAIEAIPALVLMDQDGERGRLVGQVSVAQLDRFFQDAIIQ